MRWLVIIGAALVLAWPAAARAPNACALLTNAEVAKAFGSKIATRTRDGNRYGGSCTWEGVSLGSFTSFHATLRIDIAPVTRSEWLKAARKAKNAVPVHGVGDLAYSEYMAGEFLVIWQDGFYVGVELSGVASPVPTAKTLARAALARL